MSWLAARTDNTFTVIKKGSLAPLFLLASSAWAASPELNSLIQKSAELDLASQRTWAALTHSHNRKTSLNSSTLILTESGFDPEQELVATLAILFGEDSDISRRCHFPARNVWLAEKLDISPASLDHCDGLQEYLKKAPVNRVSLIYASENISQPSSMMGHILVKISGQDSDGIERNHAVSFFTDVSGINVPKIIYDSIIAGKRGYFALTPYQGKIEGYLKREQRNVWEYKLALSDRQLRLIQLHIWELKDANPSYFFDSYNCATLTHFLLAVANPALVEKSSYLMSPLDVVKNVYWKGMVQEVLVTPSSKWQIRMIAEELPDSTARAIKESVDRGSILLLPSTVDRKQKFLVGTLAASYNDFLFEQGQRDSDSWTGYRQNLEQSYFDRDNDYVIDLSGYKNPLKAPNDGQLYVGLSHFDSGTWLKIGALPISHTLIDDNRQFFSETELRVGDLSFLVSLEDGDLELNEFQVYSATSYVPLNQFTGGISGSFRFGAEQHYDGQLKRRTAANVGGSLGITRALLRQISVFATLGGGAGWTKGDNAYLYLSPTVGVIVNGAWETKTIVTASKTFNQVDGSGDYTRIDLRHAKRLNRSFTVEADYSLLHGHRQTERHFGLTLKYLF